MRLGVETLLKALIYFPAIFTAVISERRKRNQDIIASQLSNLHITEYPNQARPCRVKFCSKTKDLLLSKKFMIPHAKDESFLF